MNRTLLVLILTLAMPPLVSAHKGHAHKIMGTVVTVQANQLNVKGTDGKMSTITVTDKTKVIHGIMAMKPADIKTGDRVVVTTAGGGKEPLVARQIQLGTSAPATKPPRKKSGRQQ